MFKKARFIWNLEQCNDVIWLARSRAFPFQMSNGSHKGKVTP